MPGTYEPIQTYTTNGSENTVTFSSIPSTYTDLVLTATVTAGLFAGLKMRFNNVSTATYSFTMMYGDGGSASSYRESGNDGVNITNIGLNSSQVRGAVVNIFNYAGSTYKSGLIDRNEPNSLIEKDVFMWSGTAAINRIDLITSTTYSGGSTFTIYGIKAA